jgi:hypothetical protein
LSFGRELGQGTALLFIRETIMDEMPQHTQPLEQTPDRKQYHAPEFRDYGTVQDLTQASGSGNTPDNGAGNGPGVGYITVN